MGASLKEKFLKYIKRIFITILCLPFVLIGLYIIFELFGMCVNHASTDRQTKELKSNLEKAIDDIQFIDIHSQTGNTTGTGNHVDCLSIVIFSTDHSLEEIKEKMSGCYEWNEGSCFIEETEEGYLFYLNTSAPFVDNIEGH